MRARTRRENPREGETRVRESERERESARDRESEDVSEAASEIVWGA